jgi:hypothetical protein
MRPVAMRSRCQLASPSDLGGLGALQIKPEVMPQVAGAAMLMPAHTLRPASEAAALAIDTAIAASACPSPPRQRNTSGTAFSI